MLFCLDMEEEEEGAALERETIVRVVDHSLMEATLVEEEDIMAAAVVEVAAAMTGGDSRAPLRNMCMNFVTL